MNITLAYQGALLGLEPRLHSGHIRDLQYAIATELAMLRRAQYHVQDSSIVSDHDLARLKDRGEIRLK